MGRTYGISRRVLGGAIVIILPIVLSPCLDISTALLISLGFGASISLWSLSFINTIKNARDFSHESFNQEPSFIYTPTSKK